MAEGMGRVGQNHIHAVYICISGRGNYQICGHTQCVHTVLANHTHVLSKALTRLLLAGAQGVCLSWHTQIPFRNQHLNTLELNYVYASFLSRLYPATPSPAAAGCC